MQTQIHHVSMQSPVYEAACRLRHRILYSGFDLPVDAIFDGNEESSTHAIMLGETEQEVLAYCQLTPSEQNSYKISQLVVDEPFRNQGLGQRLMRHLIEEARKRNGKLITIQARLDLRLFYQHLGFHCYGPVYYGKLTAIPHVEMRLKPDGDKTHHLGVPTVNLDTQQSDILAKEIDQLPPFLPSWEDLLARVYPVISRLPRSVLVPLLALKRLTFAPASLLIKRTPVDSDLPSTPPDASLPGPTVSRPDCLLLGLAQILGEPFSYHRESYNKLIHDLYPKPQDINLRAGTGSAKHLKLHTDGAHLGPNSPDFLVLSCLRADSKAITNVLDALDLVPYLSKDCFETLQRPLFRFPPPDSFSRNNTKPEQNLELPVFSGPKNNPRINMQLNTMKPLTNDAKIAIEQLSAVANEKARRIVLEPGDLLVIDNKRAAHGRQAFEASFDAPGRWLKRVYVKSQPLRDAAGFNPELRTWHI